MINVIIPMAGKGQRFVDAGYDMPKPLIQVGGKTLAEHSIESVNREDVNFFFITRTFDNPEHNEQLTKIFEKSCFSFTEIRVDSEQYGAAHSALFAEKHLSIVDPLVLINCDQIIRWDFSKFLSSAEESDGAVVIYNSDNPKNSFAKLGDDDVITEIAEKRVISNDALVGIHYWKRGMYFFESAKQLMNDYKDLGYSEAYVAPTYNYLIDSGKNIKAIHVDSGIRYISLGTPKDVDDYLNRSEPLSQTDYFNWSWSYGNYEHVNIVNDLGQDVPCIVIHDIEIDSNSDNVAGTFEVQDGFLFEAGVKGLYHGIVDVIGQYTFLRDSSLPDLVPIYFEPPKTSIDDIPDFMRSIIFANRGLGIFVVPSNFKKIKIKNLYSAYPVGNKIFYKLFIDEIPEILTDSPDDRPNAYQLSAARSAQKLFKDPHQVRNVFDEFPEKIFLHSSNKNVQELALKYVGSDFDKFISIDEYNSIVKLMEDAGFVPIDPTEYTFYQQIQIVSRASSVATLKGSNSIHSMYCGRDTTFIMINMRPENSFNHEQIVEEFINSPVIVGHRDTITERLSLKDVEDFLRDTKVI